MLKPQDIVILLKILSTITLVKDGAAEKLSQNNLAMFLCMSPSEVNAGIKRLIGSGLLAPYQRQVQNNVELLPIKPACIECLIHAVPYFIPGKLGEYTRGIPTAYAAPILKEFITMGDEPIPVWPHAEGGKKGLTLEPLYRSVPASLIKYPDTVFYNLLVLVDTIRIGRVREKNIASKLLREIIEGKSNARRSKHN